MGILTEEMQRLVQRIRLGYVATVCPDGTPNLSPKGTTTVWDDDHLVFADICSPNTVANLRHNPIVEINVVDPLLRKGYRFKGSAQVLTEGDLYEQILTFYEQRGSQRQRIRSVVLVTVERAQPLLSPAYDSGVSEDEVRRKWKSYYDNCEPQSTSAGNSVPL
jgi:predicted pyridoxine 5'-phosphate oxidase superfamily flavin-nucleotide-binding protein